MAKEIEVTQDGVTLSIPGAPDIVGRIGQRIPIDSLSEAHQQQIKDKDPWLLGMVEVVSGSAKKEPKKKESGGGSSGGGEYDPGDHTVKEVQSYLDGADAEERKRVVSAERKSNKGKDRAGILNYEPKEGSGGGVAGGQPVPGYDDLDTGQVVTLLDGNSNDAEFISKVQAYEKDHEGRSEILEYGGGGS